MIQVLFSFLVLFPIFASASPEAVGATYQPGMRTADYFERIKQDPQRLMLFLKKMPKGGDLHTHLDGATYAENLIEYGKNDDFCVEEDKMSVSFRANCLSRNKLANVSQRADVREQLINAWSMRDVALPAQEHFFSTFSKFMPIAFKHFPEILAEVQNRAADNNVLYLEPMILPDEYASGLLGKKIKWNDNFSVMESALVNKGIDQLAKASAARIVEHKVQAAEKMQCEADTVQPGCRVKVGFLYVVFRNQPPTEVFSQLVAAFKTAQQDPANIVGINLVQAEHGLYAMRDYKLHMNMIAFLKKQYPNVNVTLHAGELTKALVAPERLQSHIRDAIELGQAKRIGHGVSIAHEKDADALLRKMAKDRVLVEVNLTSNKSLLNIEGKHHPLNLYLTYGVPVALSTDDEGVLRTDITQEYMRAVSQHQVSYSQLKAMARNSITYSFLPGESMWRTTQQGFHMVPQCAGNEMGAATPSKTCTEFLGKNEKAQTQWALERSFVEFERKEWL